MFEIGKKYEIRMIIDGEETKFWRTVEKIDHPLVKFADTYFDSKNEYLQDRWIRGEIINITSPNFVSAVIHEG
ncbi:MAG TPA: hypothetical protein VGU72_25605 [Beijerinckiaceae bacterium]|jgi:hypothetical protein|nr:hypothetical protein [Beijerinckiaceae bacterium]